MRSEEIIEKRARELALQHFDIEYHIEEVHKVGEYRVLLVYEYIQDSDYISDFKILIDKDFQYVSCSIPSKEKPSEKIVKSIRLGLVTGEYNEREELDFYELKEYYKLMITGGRL